MKKILLAITVLFGSAILLDGFAQADKIEPRIDISYFKSGDDIPYVKVRIRKRIERRYYPMIGVKFEAHFNEESDQSKMGEAITNEKGEGLIEMPSAFMESWHQLDAFDFYASMGESDSTEAVRESLTITKARIKLTATDDKLLQVTLERKDEDGWNPVEDVEVKLFIKRYFGRLPVTDDYLASDEQGIVEIQFEDEVPGDEEGKLTFGALIEDHEEFGNLITYAATRWGTPTTDDNSKFNARTLWATRDKTPYWLLIFPNLIIAGIWGVIAFLIYQLIKIIRLSKV